MVALPPERFHKNAKGSLRSLHYTATEQQDPCAAIVDSSEVGDGHASRLGLPLSPQDTGGKGGSATRLALIAPRSVTALPAFDPLTRCVPCPFRKLTSERGYLRDINPPASFSTRSVAPLTVPGPLDESARPAKPKPCSESASSRFRYDQNQRILPDDKSAMGTLSVNGVVGEGTDLRTRANRGVGTSSAKEAAVRHACLSRTVRAKLFRQAADCEKPLDCGSHCIACRGQDSNVLRRDFEMRTGRNFSRWLVALCCWLSAALGQQPTESPSEARPPRAPALRSAVEIRAHRQLREGRLRRAEGDVELLYKSFVLTANELEYDESTGEVEAAGNVHYRTVDNQQDLRAERMSYNIYSELGTFYEARGRASSASQGGARLLTTDNPFQFEARLVHKAGEHYTIHSGRVTNCDPANPWWTLRSARADIVPGGAAVVRNGVLRLRGFPILYVPYFRKSLKRMPRQSGFLTPTIGNSSRFGRILGQSYYWAINRSYDATFGGTIYSARGVASNASLRGRPTKNSSFDAVFFDVRDRGRELDGGGRMKQGGNSFDMKGQTIFGNGWRGVADLHYLSSLEFRQAFTQTYEEAVFSQIRSIGFVSKNFSTFSFNTSLLRNEHFQSVTGYDNVLIRKLPGIEFNSRERRLGPKRLPLWFSFDSSLDLISRTQRSYQTRRFVQRAMFFPRVSSRLSLKGFTVTPTLGARAMAYGQRRTADGLDGTNLYRRTGEIAIDVAAPAVERIFRGPKWLGDRVKHVIEPRFRYRYTRGVEDFESTIRFDARDLAHNTNEAEVSVTNRLYAKNDSTGRVREVASLEVWQRRYFEPDFGGAVVPGSRNILQSTLDFSSFAFLSEARRYSPVATSLKLHPSSRWNLRWRNDYDPLRGKLVNTTADTTVEVSPKIRVTAGHRAVRVPEMLTPPSNQLLTGLRYGDYNRRGWNAALYNVYDYRQGIFLYSISQLTYNTDCCGFSVELRRLSIGNARSDNQIRISLAIANVGSFGTLRPAERMF